MSADPPIPSRSSGSSLRDVARYVGALLVVPLGAAAFAIVFRELLSGVFRFAFHASDVVSAFARLPRLVL